MENIETQIQLVVPIFLIFKIDFDLCQLIFQTSILIEKSL